MSLAICVSQTHCILVFQPYTFMLTDANLAVQPKYNYCLPDMFMICLYRAITCAASLRVAHPYELLLEWTDLHSLTAP